MDARVILTAFLKALGQLGDRRFRRVLLIGIGLTFALLVAASTGFLLFLQWAIGDEAVLPIIGPVTWLSDLVSWAGFGVMMVLSVFLMMPVASAITSMFLDEVAQAVEDRHYPDLPRVPGVPFLEALRDTLNFLGVLIGANVVAFVSWLITDGAADYAEEVGFAPLPDDLVQAGLDTLDTVQVG